MIIYVNFTTKSVESKQESCQIENPQRDEICRWCDEAFISKSQFPNIFCSQECQDEDEDYHLTNATKWCNYCSSPYTEETEVADYYCSKGCYVEDTQDYDAFLDV